MELIAKYDENDVDAEFYYFEDEVQGIKDVIHGLSNAIAYAVRRAAWDIHHDDTKMQKNFCDAVLEAAKLFADAYFEHKEMEEKIEKDLSDQFIEEMLPVYTDFLDEEGLKEEMLIKAFRESEPEPRVSVKNNCYVFEIIDKKRVILTLGSVGCDNSTKEIKREAVAASIIVTYICDRAFSKDDIHNFARFERNEPFIYRDILIDMGIISTDDK